MTDLTVGLAPFLLFEPFVSMVLDAYYRAHTKSAGTYSCINVEVGKSPQSIYSELLIHVVCH